MKILVLVKIVEGELNPFDASALEFALRQGGEITVVSMCPPSAERVLQPLTRLGTERVILLSDSVFAGSDTLATARILSEVVHRLNPQVIFCGRQSIDGDTAQVGPEIAAMCGFPVITNVMQIRMTESAAECTTRSGLRTEALPAVLTFEKVFPLRFPSIRSKAGQVERWSNRELNMSASLCGWNGSPTRVLQTFENVHGRRHCTFISYDELAAVLRKARAECASEHQAIQPAANPLSCIAAVGETVRLHAEALAQKVLMLQNGTPQQLTAQIHAMHPDAVLWNADAWGRETAPQVAALLQTGLCADCTQLETDGRRLLMYRPAKGGNIMAKIECRTNPQMATVRTSAGNSGLIVSAGKGIASQADTLRQLIHSIGGQSGASRGLVDANGAPYDEQIGLTGRSVAPQIYIAIGISGAVHHTCGIENSGIIIGINPDHDARIFDYADFGIAAEYDEQAFADAMRSIFA